VCQKKKVVLGRPTDVADNFGNALILLAGDFRQTLRKDIDINYKYACPGAERSVSGEILTSIAGNWKRKGAG
jgi:hypothetical protein